MPEVAFRYWDQAFPSFQHRLHALISEPEVTDVCDIGGGADPGVVWQEVTANDLNYLVTDVSEQELGKVPPSYTTRVFDACAGAGPDMAGSFDLVFSHLVAEHVPDPLGFHTTIFELLRPGGRALHFFPTLYTVPFTVNRLLPEAALGRLLGLVQSGRDSHGSHGKFPAAYRWCRGPSRTRVARFEALGYEVESYVGYFGHGYYRPIPALDKVEQAKSRALARRPVPALTAFALLELRRPAA